MDLDHPKEHETLPVSLCGDIQIRVSLVLRGVTEEKLQRILDSRLPQALVELWKSKKRNVQGRISVPTEMVQNNAQLQRILQDRHGRFIFIGPIKVHLRKESPAKEKQTLKRKMAALEKQQLEMKSLLERLVLERENILPSPGRTNGDLNCKLKRKASVKIVPVKKQKKHSVREDRNGQRKNHTREEVPDPDIQMGSMNSTMKLSEIAACFPRGNEDAIRELQEVVAGHARRSNSSRSFDVGD